MLMSASSPDRSAGFSLLELMVVLGLVSLISGVVFPGLARLYDAVQASNEQEEIIAQINMLGVQAWQSRQAFSLLEKLTLPEGWEVRVRNPIYYRANGFCVGGTAQLVRHGETRRSVSLKSPYCQVQNES